MAINFPDSPSNGDTHTAGGKTFTYDSTVGAWSPAPAGATTFIGLTDTPSSFGTASQIPAINSGANALEFIALPSSVTVYATVDLLPLSGNSAGDQAFVTATNRLYIWNGSGWYNIALINTTPSISGVSSSYALATDGTATTVTITATDPEGLPITYSIASDTSGNIATVAQGTGASSNIFTITPSTNSANAGTFSLTFRASDGVNLATAPATFTLQFSVTNQNYTTALITSIGSNGATNGTFVDSSSANKTVTNLNASQTSFSPYRHGGYSTYFDGSGDYLTPSSVADIGANDFTLECWVYATDATQDSQFRRIVCSKANASDSVQIYINTNGQVVYTANDDAAIKIIGSTDIRNGWHHVAVVRSGSGSNNVTLYIDGASEGTETDSNSKSSSAFTIGKYPSLSGHFKGYLTDVRLVIGTALYTSAFTRPTERLTAVTNTSLLTCHLPYIADGSTNGHAITVTGNTKTEPFAPYDTQEYTVGDHGGSYAMVSRSGVTGPSIDVASDPDFAFGTDPFTIEFWYYPNQAGAQWDQLITTTGNNGIFFANRSGYLDWTNNQDQAALIRSPWPAVGQWSHIVLTQDSTTRAVFINGVRTGTASTAHSWAQGQFRVAYGAGRGNFSNIRIVKGTAVYDPSQSTLTVPTAPLTDVTNTKLLLKGENGGIIDKAQVAKEIRLISVTSSTAQYKYLPSSIYFDGNGDYIETPAIQLGTAAFTIEAWVRLSVVTTSVNIPFISTGTGSNAGTFQFEINSSNYLNFKDNQTSFSSSSGLTVDTWHHIAFAREGTGTNQARIFLDGSVVATGTVTGNFNDTNRFLIGTNRNINSYVSGYMSDIRVTKGLARYTTAFTPPTAALQG